MENHLKGSLITVITANIANILIALAKTLAAIFSGSASLTAEAAHSWSDSANGAFLIMAEKKSVKPADASHPLGYGKEAYVWSMMAAFGIFTAGAVVSIYTGIHDWNSQEINAHYAIGYAILVIAFLLEGYSWLTSIREGRKASKKAKRSALSYILSSSNPTLRGVFFEDAAALIGLIIAALGMGIHQYTGDGRWDAAGSILVGCLLGFVAIYLIRKNRDFLVGQRVSKSISDAALQRLIDDPQIDSVSYLHMEWVGPEKIFMIAAVDIAGNQLEHDVAKIFEEIESRLRREPLFQEVIITLSAPGANPIVVDDAAPE